MKVRNRLTVEPLEDRWCPAVTATLRSGTLTISGAADNGTIQVMQDATTAGTIQVLDGDSAVGGSPFTGVTNIRLNLTDADDDVTIDLGGQTLSGGILANLGAGANELTVVNGSVGGRLAVRSGDGDDTVTLGDGTDALALRDADIALYGGIDAVTVSADVSITRTLATFYVNEWALEEGGTANNVYVRCGSGGNTVEVVGDVTGDLVIDAFFRSGSDAGTTANVTGEVDGGVYFFGSDQDDTLNLAGDVGRGVVTHTYGGADKVSLGGAVTRGLTLDTGAGDDQITLGGSVGGRGLISAGAGNDTLTISATAQFLGSATVSLGSGNDAVALDAAAGLVTLLLNGGTGTDTFTGTRTRTGLTLVSF